MNPRALRYSLPLLVALLTYLATSRGCELPIPIPVDPPVPVVVDGLHILIIEETAERHTMPPEQQAILASVKLREAVQAAGGQMRIFDDDTDLSGVESVWRDLMAVERDGLPWLLVVNGRRGVSRELPGTVDEVVAIVEQYR